MTRCYFCEVPVDPTARGIAHQVTGWQVKAVSESRRSGSDIIKREPTGKVACAGCITALKHNLPIQQGSLI